MCRRALVELRPALAGHAAFETYWLGVRRWSRGAAQVHGRILLTRDHRAERTYRAVGVGYEVLR